MLIYFSRNKMLRFIMVGWMTVWMVLPPGVAWSNPSGGSVQTGSATVNGQGTSHVTVQQSSDRAIVHWNSFSNQLGETITFVQPGASSAMLNRVTGGSASNLNGALNANGKVYLVNPNGVVIGKTGRVNTAGFTASTHDVANSEFMTGGDMTFRGTGSASVVNHGKIRATEGDVTLIARQVENHGRISARRGEVTLAGGTEVLVKPSGSEGQRVFIKSTSGSGSVSNTGSIRATAVELRAAGGNEYALAVNNSGVIRATKIDRSGGRIVLRAERQGDAGSPEGAGTVQNSGRLIASSNSPGKRGGSVIMTGENVKLTSTSRIDVSSTGSGGKGGTVNMGGGFQGKDAAIANAKTTTVEAGSLIHADGGTGPESKGGSVIVWSDGRTDYLGSITARGAGRDVAGSGGFVEVSSKGLLNYVGTVNTAGGTLLLDPAILEIIATGGSASIAGASTLEAGTLESDLAAHDVILDATNFIAVNAPVGWSSIYNLTFETPTLYLNAPIAYGGSGVLTATASSPTGIFVGTGGIIQNAIHAANPSSVTPPTVYLTAPIYNQSNISVAKAITIKGHVGPTGEGSATVEGDFTTSIFNVGFAGPGNRVTFDSLVITKGAIGLNVTGIVTVRNTIFDNNQSGLAGGGIYAVAVDLTVINSTFINNSASNNGGGLTVHGGDLTVINSTFSNNYGGTGGGGIAILGPIDATILNSTFSDNWADWGGALFSNSADSIFKVSNSILANSKDRFGTVDVADIFARGGGGFVDNGYNLIKRVGSVGAFTLPGSTSRTGIDPMLTPLGWYGGQRQTRALLPGSPALDSGTPSYSGPGTDQRGFARVTNGRVDIGAFESSGFTYHVVGGALSTELTRNFAPITVGVTSLDPGLTNLSGGTFTYTVVPNAEGASITGPLTQTVTLTGTGPSTSTLNFTANDVPGTYAVRVTGLASPLFSLTNLPISLLIRPDAGQGKTYGDSTPVLGYTFYSSFGTGAGALLSGDTLNGALGIFSENAGLTPFTLGTLTAGGKYALVLDPASPLFTILQRPLNVVPISGQGKTQGQPDPVLLYTIAGSLAPWDSVGSVFAGSLGRVPGENPGQYSYAFGSLSNPNYALILSPDLFTITGFSGIDGFNATRGRNNEDAAYYEGKGNTDRHQGTITFGTPSVSPGDVIYSSSSYQEFQGN